nr:hypothetical protein [Tanacetum cinerariifolium]
MNYQPITAGNQGNKNAGPREVNGDTGLKKNVDIGHIRTIESVYLTIYCVSIMLLQEKVTRSSSTNCITTVSTPVNTASASRTFIPPHDPLMPELEDTTEIQTTGIFGNAYDKDALETNNHSYAYKSVHEEADFNNMVPSTIVSPITITRVHSNHPKAQIIGDPMLAVQTR